MEQRMGNSFQNEIPKARVNITLDIEGNNKSNHKELPMKLLVLGDFSNNQSDEKLHQRTRVNINKSNINEIMASFSPSINLDVTNKILPEAESLKSEITFKEIKDFSPAHIVQAVPVLNKLQAMRNLIKDLKANVLDNKSFRKKLEKILKDKEQKQTLLKEINDLKQNK